MYYMLRIGTWMIFGSVKKNIINEKRKKKGEKKVEKDSVEIQIF